MCNLLPQKNAPFSYYKQIKLKCGTYRDPQGFYNGPEIRTFALKTPKGVLLAAVNQNPAAAESGSLEGLPGKRLISLHFRSCESLSHR